MEKESYLPTCFSVHCHAQQTTSILIIRKNTSHLHDKTHTLHKNFNTIKNSNVLYTKLDSQNDHDKTAKL